MIRALFLPLAFFGISCSIHASHGRHLDGYHYRVVSAAFDLERAAATLRRDAEYALHHGRRHDARALNEIRKLESRTRSLRRTVERRYWDEQECRRDFDRVLNQYDRTERQLRYAVPARSLYRSLDGVRRLIGRFQNYYGVYGYYPGRPYR